MKYPKREINSEPFMNQLDIIEKLTIEIKHQSNNPIFKSNINNHSYSKYNNNSHNHNHNHNHNNHNNKYYNSRPNQLYLMNGYINNEIRTQYNNNNSLDKLFDPFKPVKIGYGSMNGSIWNTNNNSNTNTPTNSSLNGNYIY